MKKKKISKEEIDGKAFFVLNQRIIEREKNRRKLMIDNIEDIGKMLDEKLFLVEFENYAGFLGQIEVYYSRAEVWRLMKIKEKLIDEFKLNPMEFFDIDITRLEMVAKYAVDEKAAETLLGQARHLTSRDWRDTINTLRGKPQMENCSHKNELYEICKLCGNKHKVDSDV